MKKAYILLLLIALTFLVSACSNTKELKLTEESYKVKDELGQEIFLRAKPEKIVSLTYGTDEILFALVDTKRIKAISKWSDHPELSFLTKEETSKVKDRVEANTESILREKPDLVITSVSTGADAVETLKEAGIPVYVASSPKTLEEMEKKIKGIAVVVGEVKQGENIIHEMHNRLNKLEEKLKPITKDKEKVCIVYAFTGAIGRKGNLMDNMLKLAHIRNGAAEIGLVHGNTISKEQVVNKNPDMVFLPSWNFGHGEDDPKIYERQFLEDPALKNIKAVKNKQVFVVQERFRYASSHHVIDGIETYAKLAYPELFGKET